MSKGTGPLSKIYNVVIFSIDKIVPGAARPLWEAPAGPRTVFFWAPFFKWTLVMAGLSDLLNRPPQNVSLNQAGSLAATGLIWSRYSVVITPKNYNLLSVNVFVFLTQAYLIYKHLMWRKSNAKNAMYNHPYFPFWMEDDW
ncbi:CG32832 [Drosophila busckii]|uniref:Mitochondrial pyruvate carrier n=1 Tax=Drosophila busckii TaxID=30019 RepID=A0A0M3QTZ9_DROBS|nr:mitochondrial pyruvate carrier 2 [Drosophila busckii]ALC39793.1 CG32832 [Drosophila busckii]